MEAAADGEHRIISLDRCADEIDAVLIGRPIYPVEVPDRSGHAVQSRINVTAAEEQDAVCLVDQPCRWQRRRATVDQHDPHADIH